jgi:transcriptional regulator with PAS, ATPase and Fis domain
MKKNDKDQLLLESDDDGFSLKDIEKVIKFRGNHFQDAVSNYKKYRERLKQPSDQLGLTDLFIKGAMPYLFHGHVPEGMIFIPEVHEKSYLYAEKLSKGNMNILIQGESGSGKTYLANFIHMQSNRKENKFVTINAALYSDKESFQGAFFGIKGGVYTDVKKDTKGIIVDADNSTLFVDEVDKLELSLQGLLLHLIETGEYRLTGDREIQKVSTRFLFGTNANLKNMIESRAFLPDLYWRIQYPTIQTVPFRKWPKIEFFKELCRINPSGDIRLYFDDYYPIVQKQTNDFKLWDEYQWPGNQREFVSYFNTAMITGDWREYFQQSLSDIPPSSPKPPFLKFDEPVDQYELRKRYAEALLSSEKSLIKVLAKGRLAENTFKNWLKLKK